MADNMVAIKWQLNSELNVYDIVNEFQKNNLEVIKSKLLIQLGTFKGEWAPDPDFGISSSLLQENQLNPDVLVQIIIDEILKIENVKSATVTSTEFDSSRRLLSATFSVNTVYGTTTVSQGF